jgi:murein DD-endopeptidase MepM/ murein hydrolase activator NlpD
MRQLRAFTLVVLLAAASSAPTGGYTVRWGDTLSAIGKRLGVNTSALADANGIQDPNRIQAGQVLTIPAGGTAAASSAGVFHVVRAGENLATIARRFGTTPAAIVHANGLRDPNRIQAGQQLAIPGQQWLCPVKGYTTVTDSFGDPRPGGRRHQGVDVYAARGTPVVASVGGVVRHVKGPVAGYAYYLAGDDGTTYYGAHLDSYVASAGRVPAGGVIGRVGNTGNAAPFAPHLHFEVHPGGGAAVDPYALVSRAC